MLADLLERAKGLGHHTVVALVCGEQAGSLRLHEEMGFTRTGRIREAGYKFDQWLDVVYLQRMV